MDALVIVLEYQSRLVNLPSLYSCNSPNTRSRLYYIGVASFKEGGEARQGTPYRVLVEGLRGPSTTIANTPLVGVFGREGRRYSSTGFVELGRIGTRGIGGIEYPTRRIDHSYSYQRGRLGHCLRYSSRVIAFGRSRFLW